MVITPVNYALAAVNFFVGTTGLVQLGRIYKWRQEHPVLAAVEDKVHSNK